MIFGLPSYAQVDGTVTQDHANEKPIDATRPSVHDLDTSALSAIQI